MKSLVLTLAAILLCLDLIERGLAEAHAAEPSKRQKVIDFEDQIVEGMNKRPLDSLNQLSEKHRRRNQKHLYRKRGGFRTEVALSLEEMRLIP